MGRRSTRWRIISKEILPEPTMTAARNSVTGTPLFRRVLAGFLSGAKVGRKVGLAVSEAAEVDDAVDASLLGGYAEVAGGLQVQFLKAGGASDAVNEVVGAVDALQGFR